MNGFLKFEVTRVTPASTNPDKFEEARAGFGKGNLGFLKFEETRAAFCRIAPAGWSGCDLPPPWRYETSQPSPAHVKASGGTDLEIFKCCKHGRGTCHRMVYISNYFLKLFFSPSFFFLSFLFLFLVFSVS